MRLTVCSTLIGMLSPGPGAKKGRCPRSFCSSSVCHAKRPRESKALELGRAGSDPSFTPSGWIIAKPPGPYLLVCKMEMITCSS